jgi:hypothetical protein
MVPKDRQTTSTVRVNRETAKTARFAPRDRSSVDAENGAHLPSVPFHFRRRYVGRGTSGRERGLASDMRNEKDARFISLNLICFSLCFFLPWSSIHQTGVQHDKRDSRNVRGVVFVACCRRHYNARLVRLSSGPRWRAPAFSKNFS